MRELSRALRLRCSPTEVGGGVMKCPNRGLSPRCARRGPYAWCTAAYGGEYLAGGTRVPGPLFGSLSFITGASCARLRA